MRVLDRSGCTGILRWCVHPDLRRRFLEQSECLRFTILPRIVSRCHAILQRTIAKSPATHTAAQTHRQTHRQTDTQTEVVRKQSERNNLTQF